jgi:UPF0755 protein
MATGARRKNSSRKSIFGKLVIIGVILLGIAALIGYKKLFKPNVKVEMEGGKTFLYIRTGSSFEQVLSSLNENQYLCDPKSFEWMALKMNYPNNVKPGKYKISNGMTNRELLNMLRAGRQVPVKVMFHNIRFKKELASSIGKQLEADSTELLKLLNDEIFLAKYNFNKQTIPAMFIPNTYEFYWNTSASEFVSRMNREYLNFWNSKRKRKAENLNLSLKEVSTLASIVEEETDRNSEMPAISGVYLNRLKKGMPLQADPTVKFAYGDFSIKRIYEKHINFDSPYNTYKNTGLPPGPICIPSITSIDAVLNTQKHEYLYFCAKEDFSGYHNFARTLSQHNQNAEKYRKALNRAGIRR